MNPIVVDEDALSRLIEKAVRKALRPIAVDLLCSQEVAEMLRVDRRTLRRLVGEGAVPAPIVIGERTIRWRRKTLERFLAGRERAALKHAPHAGSVVS